MSTQSYRFSITAYWVHQGEFVRLTVSPLLPSIIFHSHYWAQFKYPLTSPTISPTTRLLSIAISSGTTRSRKTWPIFQSMFLSKTKRFITSNFQFFFVSVGNFFFLLIEKFFLNIYQVFHPGQYVMVPAVPILPLPIVPRD